MSAPRIDSPFTVALTGGIASGKTLVSDEFKNLGTAVVDTDVIAHEIVEPGKPALLEISDAFGEGIIDENGKLKRTKLRELIFTDPPARGILESILHPKIRAKVSHDIATIKQDYCILVIPLLVERGNYPDVDRVLLVDVDPEIQITRLMARDNCSRQQAEQALASQANREDRLSIADDVLDNSGSPGAIVAEVLQLHQKYINLAQKRNQRNQTR